MENFLSKYMPDADERSRRRALGILFSGLGIALNLSLFLLKTIAGTISGSIAITADAFNNLSDAGSSLLSLLGFKLADVRTGSRYPFGIGRVEYLSGMLISAAILSVGGRLMISSIQKIVHPTATQPRLCVVVILLFAIGIKLFMYLYNRHFGRSLDSSGMRAAAVDSLSDCFATLAILLSMAVERLCGVNIDGICGVMVAMCILYAGALSMKDALSPLLGAAASDKTIDDIADIVCAHSAQILTLDIRVHDYGPMRRIAEITLSGTADSRRIKSALTEELGMDSVIEVIRPSE